MMNLSINFEIFLEHKLEVNAKYQVSASED